ncbi:MAG: 50S ribosome-binding GTPase [Kiritimatiellae bacterium]|nr:50S ribosome-binding GTPase [Kiritimatiellia bacterium]
MERSLQRLDQEANRVAAWDRGGYETVFPAIPSREALTGIVREYRAFTQALCACSEAAREESGYIGGRIHEIQELGRSVDGIVIPEADVDLPSGLTEEERGSFAEQRKMVLDTFASVKREFKTTFQSLETELKRLAEDSADFKVVLFGRTMVRKSTIREALTGGDGATIGHGDQSTTKEVHCYEWRRLHVFDTPGINSSKDTGRDAQGIGDEERLANQYLDLADLAVVVFKTDTVEVSERLRLDQIVKSGRPYVILLNVVADITDYAKFRKRRKDRMISCEAQQEFIDDLLCEPDDGKKPYPPEVREHVIAVHARACFLSRARGSAEADAFFQRNDVPRSELYTLSRFGEFRDRLTAFIGNQGVASRKRTIDTFFIEKTGTFFSERKISVSRLREKTAAQIAAFEMAKKNLRRKFGAWRNRLATCLRDHLTQAGLDTDGFAHDAILNGLKKETIASSWNQTMQRLMGKAAASFQKEVETELQRQLENLGDALTFNDTSFAGLGEINDDTFNGRKVLKWTSRVLGIGGAIAFCFPGPGTVIGIVAGVVALAIDWLSSLFKSKETKIHELKQQLDASVEKSITDIVPQFTAALQTGEAQICTALERTISAFRSFQDGLGKLEKVFGQADAVVAAVRSRMETRLAATAGGKGEK